MAKRIVSKIVVIKIGDMYIKALQMGDKAVVRKQGGILFNNLHDDEKNFDKWWKQTIDILGKNNTVEVIKAEKVKNSDMEKILEKYK